MSNFNGNDSRQQQEVAERLITLKPLPERTLATESISSEYAREHYEQIINEAKSKAKDILESANKQSLEIQEQIELDKLGWEEEKLKLIEQAQEQGYKAGEKRGRKDGYEEMHGHIAEAKHVIALSKENYNQKIAESEQVILRLGISLAEKVINEKIAADDKAFESLVKAVLKEVREDREVQIHINPSYYELLTRQKDELLSIFPGETSLYLYPDDDLEETECFIESESGRLDASVDSQLAELKQKLLELLEGE